MRDLNECKAEIFRRSNEKLKKKRNRRIAVLSACTPLCLIVIVWSVTILPAMMPASSAGDFLPEASSTDVQDSNDNCLTEIQIYSSGTQKTVSFTEESRMIDIYFSLSESFDDNSSAKGDDPESENTMNEETKAEESIGNDTSVESSETPSGRGDTVSKYTITVITKDGNESVYTLFSNKLTDHGSKNTVYLSVPKLNALKDVLGIS